jgi:SAM-dependent methyltransferase
MPLSLDYWLSSEGSSLLRLAQNLLLEFDGETLRSAAAIRKRAACSPEAAAEALSFAVLRTKAQQRGITWAAEGFFTRQSLEQATAPEIARYHAARFAGCKHVLEVCSGAGFDTAALANAVAANDGRVTSIERDEYLVALARQNLAVQHITNVEVMQGKAEEVIQHFDISSFDGLWADPSRRDSQGQRIRHPDFYEPSLDWLMRLPVPGVRGIKLAPALNCGDFYQPTVIAQWKREWTGTLHECREQIVWRNANSLQDNTASIIDDHGVWHTWQPEPCVQEQLQTQVAVEIESLAGRYLVEPHGCIIRTGALDTFFAEREIIIPDTHIAYGIAQIEPVESIWYKAFRIREAFPFTLAELKKRVQKLGWSNSTEIKKRGFPETPDEIRKKLKLPSSGTAGVIFLTRLGTRFGTRFGTRHVVVLAERVNEKRQ